MLGDTLTDLALDRKSVQLVRELLDELRSELRGKAFALGGRLYAPGFCALHAGGGSPLCAHDGNCSIRPVLVGLDRLVHDALSKMTLKSLVRSEPAMHQFVHVRLGA